MKIGWLKSLRSKRSKPPTVAEGPNRLPGWIAVDLDGTLAEYDGWRGFKHIGPPISLMKQRVLNWIEAGHTIKVFTARASATEGIAPVKEWLARNGFPDLEVTNKKDFEMIELWDDRAVQVISNSGRPVILLGVNSYPKVPLLINEVAGTTFELSRERREPALDRKAQLKIEKA